MLWCIIVMISNKEEEMSEEIKQEIGDEELAGMGKGTEESQ